MQKHQQLATLTSPPCPATHQEAQVKRNSALEWIAMCTRETRGITTCLIFLQGTFQHNMSRVSCPLGALYLWLLRLSLGLKNPGNLSNCRVSVQILLLVPWKSQTSACRRTLELPRCPAAPRSSEHPPAKVSRPTRRHSASGSCRRSP